VVLGGGCLRVMFVGWMDGWVGDTCEVGGEGFVLDAHAVA